MIIHPDGLATEYYQLTSGTRLADGSQVKRGDYLGNVGVDHPCGGGTGEPQVRFGLRHADQGVAIDGWTIGGWTFHAGTGADTFVAVRDDLQALPGEPVVNLGVPRLPGIAPNPSIDPELPLPSLKPDKPAKSR
jgi:murein DD-endopeptidase MepM/ murein hydrolase activator NlpD